MSDIQYDVQININLAKIDQALNGVGQKIGQKISRDVAKPSADAGRQAGTSFGNSFASAFASLGLGTMFKNIVSGSIGAVRANSAYELSTKSLTGAIQNANKSELAKVAIVKDSTKSIEERAGAIGISADQIYEDTKAVQSNAKAIDSQEALIRKQERAFEDATKAIEGNITAQEKNRDAQIKAIRDAKGFSNLTTEQQKLEEELTNLELTKLEATKSGNIGALVGLDNQIKAKKLDLDITETKIKQIDQQTDKIKDLYEVQIQALRAELSASKNKFDIDIEPAKRKLEDLKATNITIGGGQVVKKSVLDAIATAKVKEPKLVSEKDVAKMADQLFTDFNGAIQKQELNAIIKDLVIGGVKDIGEISTTIKGLTDIASAGKSPFITLGNAVSQLAEQFRNERGALGETAGLSEEYISDIIPQTLQMLQAQGELVGKNVDSLSTEERAYVKRIGILGIAARSQGAFNNYLNSSAFEMDKVKVEGEKLQREFGEQLTPAVVTIAKELVPLIKQFADFISQNPQLVTAIVLAAGALSGLGSIIGGIAALWPVLQPVFIGIGTFFAGITAPVWATVAAIAGLVAGLIIAYQKFDWFRDGVNNNLKKITDWFNWAKNNWVEALGQVIGFIISWPAKVFTIMKQMSDNIISFFTNPSNIDSLKNAVGDWFAKAFSADNMKRALNGVIDFVSGIVRGIGAGIPGSEAITNPIIDTLNRQKKAAIGADFVVPPGFNGDNYPVMAKSGERVQVSTQQQTSINSGNTVNNNVYGSTSSGGFLPGFLAFS